MVELIKQLGLQASTSVSDITVPPEVETGFGKFNTTGGFFQSILNIALAAAAFVAVILVVKGGFQLTMSGGNPQKIKEGKDQIVNALTGLFLIAAAIFVIKVVATLVKESGISINP